MAVTMNISVFRNVTAWSGRKLCVFCIGLLFSPSGYMYVVASASSRIYIYIYIYIHTTDYTALSPIRLLRRKAFSLCWNLECADKRHVENEIWDPESSCPNFLYVSSWTSCNNVNSVYPQCCPTVAMNLTYFRMVSVRKIKPRTYYQWRLYIKFEKSWATSNSMWRQIWRWIRADGRSWEGAMASWQTTPRRLEANDQLSTRERTRIYKKWGHNLNSRDAPFHRSCGGSTQERKVEEFRTHPLSFTNCTCSKNNQWTQITKRKN
jgi:hypothetical protein